MNAVRQSVRPKHQVLILKCFPRYQKGVLQVKPNPSELSYLLYYVSTRRSKLQKVGAFLEKKAARDVSKARFGNVQVLLQILTALVEKLPRELPLYAHSVLTIIETVINSRDVNMVEETVPTFEMFCTSQDLSVLAAEQRYATQYLNIVRSYASFASSQNNGPFNAANNLPIALRLKNIGLRAIRSMVNSESLSGDGGKQLSIIVPVILENLYVDGSEDILVSLQLKAQNSEKAENEGPRQRRRTSTATVQSVDAPVGDAAEASGTTADADKAAESEVRVLALRCLERIFVVTSNRSQIRTAAGLALQFIVDHQGQADSEKFAQDSSTWAQSLMELIAKWCPVQDRFIVLFTAVEILRGMSADDDPVQQQIVMASLIDSLLKSPVNMIGLSVIDVLVGFVQHLLRLLQTPSPPASASPVQQPAPIKRSETANDTTVNCNLERSPESHFLTPENEKLALLLKKCIGDLATHIYYADQIFDMVRTLLKRIRPPVALDTTAGAVANSVSEPSASANQIPNSTHERQSENFFYTANARVAALEAIKDILVVANLKKPSPTGASIISRNPVGIQVWEGTQWLLRDSNRQVQTAYAEALLSWLQLETSKCDLHVRDTTRKVSRSRSKKDLGGARKASASSAAAVIDKKPVSAASNFLQLIHLTLYDIAVESASVDPDIFIVYLILVSLVEHLGVNAVRFGLPMVLKLQEVIPASDSLSSADAQVNIGSLVYGYLLALSEKFDFETSKVGADLHREISKRRKCGAWLECVQFPPLPLSEIPHPDSKVSRSDVDVSFSPFTTTEEIVRQIENAYTASLIAAPQSPPGSPGSAGKNPTQVYGQALSTPDSDNKLPADIKEDMLSPWSREASIAVLVKEKAKAASVSGSKHASSATRNYGSLNGFGSNSSNRESSPATDRQDNNGPEALGIGVSGFRVSRSTGFPNGSFSDPNRDSTIRVDDLKRMLSVAGSSNVRRSSPLRGRLDDNSGSVVSSSSESMVSEPFSTSDFGSESRPQSIRESGRSASRDGSETPKASASNALPSSSSTSQAGKKPKQNDQPFAGNDDDIPPVPPLPSGLAIPGGFPDTSSNLSRQSSVRSDHHASPTTVNFARNGSLRNNKNGGPAGKTLLSKKSKSNNSLSSSASASRRTTPTPTTATTPVSNNNTAQSQIDKLLDSVLPQEAGPHFDQIQVTPDTLGLTRGKSRTVEERRRITSGIGRPPY